MPRSQLAINCPQELLERLRGAAQQQRTTVTALVLGWLEAGLDGCLDAPRPASSSDLDQRLEAVEQRLDAIDSQSLAQHSEQEEEIALLPPQGRGNKTDSNTTRFTDRGHKREENGPDNVSAVSRGAHGNSQSTTEKRIGYRCNVSTSGLDNIKTSEVLTTAELAESLGKSRTALNERLRRAGGGVIGLELEGWKIVGKAKPAQGGPPQWQWQAI